MQAVPDHFEFATDRAEFRALPGRAGVELYRAHIVRHAFEPHTREAYGFGVIEPALLADITGDAGWWFDDAVVERDRLQGQHLSRLLEALWQTQDPLAFDGLLAQGVAPAEVAARAGLTDQAHLTRAFRNRYGVAPARYQRQVSN